MSDKNAAPLNKLPPWMEDHRRRYLETDGVDGHMYVTPAGGAAVPTLLLTTTGRHSGLKLMLPLIYGTVGDSYAVIASKGGAPQHPGWYFNLVANPQVEVQVLARRFVAVARISTGAERADIWKRMVEVFPPYADYAKKTTREIPVVVLDPAN